MFFKLKLYKFIYTCHAYIFSSASCARLANYRGKNRMLDPWELELQRVIIHHIGALNH